MQVSDLRWPPLTAVRSHRVGDVAGAFRGLVGAPQVTLKTVDAHDEGMLQAATIDASPFPAVSMIIVVVAVVEAASVPEAIYAQVGSWAR